MSVQEYKTSLKEKIPYGMYYFGQGMIYTLVSQFLMMYYTDYALLPSLAVSVIMFGGKIWDGINDTLFGLIMDKLKWKSGKRFIPWLKISMVAIPLSTVLLFSIEDVENKGLRIAAAVITYVIWDLCYTVSDAPILALPTAMTPNVKDRASFMTFSGMGGAASMALSAIIIPVIFKKYGFFNAGLIAAAVGFFAMSLVTFTCKERYHVETKTEKEPTLKETFMYLKGNRYLLLFYGYRLVSGMVSVSMLSYMAKYCLNDVAAVSTIALYSMPMIIAVYLLSPILLKKLDKIVIYRVCIILTAVMYVITYLIGFENKQIVLVSMAVIAALAIMPSIIMGALPQDCIEYGTFKTGIRKEGITFALQSFISKVIAAFASANGALIFHFAKYDGSLEVQPPEIVNLIWSCCMLIPAAGMLLGLGFLFAYNLKDSDVQLMSSANEGKISREEALEKMTRSYK